jgi:hypothetical protein
MVLVTVRRGGPGLESHVWARLGKSRLGGRGGSALVWSRKGKAVGVRLGGVRSVTFR